jgi:hypothetical protein
VAAGGLRKRPGSHLLRRHGIAGQAGQRELGTGIGQPGLGAQHEHGQALQGRRQKVPAAHEQDLVGGTPQADEAGLHAALGGAEGGQPGLALAQQHEVLGQLALEEFRGVLALHPDHAEMVEGGDTVERMRHGLNYHGRHIP